MFIIVCLVFDLDVFFLFFFFFQRKTAYDLRISYWSSDVCSSYLLVVVEPCEYATAFGVSGFVGHNTTFVDDGTGLGVVSYMTAADDTGAWDRAAVWAHEAGHAEGETDILEAADSLYSYGWVHDEQIGRANV